MTSHLVPHLGTGEPVLMLHVALLALSLCTATGHAAPLAASLARTLTGALEPAMLRQPSPTPTACIGIRG